MTPEQIRRLRRTAREAANKARNVQTLINSYAFTVWADGADYEDLQQMIEAGDLESLREMRGPTSQQVRDEAQRMKIDNYWSRAAFSLKAELSATEGSMFYDG